MAFSWSIGDERFGEAGCPSAPHPPSTCFPPKDSGSPSHQTTLPKDQDNSVGILEGRSKEPPPGSRSLQDPPHSEPPKKLFPIRLEEAGSRQPSCNPASPSLPSTCPKPARGEAEPQLWLGGGGGGLQEVAESLLALHLHFRVESLGRGAASALQRAARWTRPPAALQDQTFNKTHEQVV